MVINKEICEQLTLSFTLKKSLIQQHMSGFRSRIFIIIWRFVAALSFYNVMHQGFKVKHLRYNTDIILIPKSILLCKLFRWHVEGNVILV